MMNYVGAPKLRTVCLQQESPQKERWRNGRDVTSVTNGLVRVLQARIGG